jgi:DNA-binding beta-propeller fold protein YncE
MSCKPPVVATLAVMLCLVGLAKAQDSGPYKVLKIQLIGGDGGFDYVTVDSDGRNLYVARSGPAGHIGVYNLDTLAQVGDIPGVSAHGGAVDTATGHGFATSKPVTMFDSKTFAILKKIDVQGNPDGYLNDAYNHHFYILSHSAPNIPCSTIRMDRFSAPSTSAAHLSRLPPMATARSMSTSKTRPPLP